MTRAHRRWHLVAWLLIGPVLALGMLLGVLLRPAAGEGPAISQISRTSLLDRAP